MTLLVPLFVLSLSLQAPAPPPSPVVEQTRVFDLSHVVTRPNDREMEERFLPWMLFDAAWFAFERALSMQYGGVVEPLLVGYSNDCPRLKLGALNPSR